MSATPQELFERYVRGAMNRDADAQATLFADDGVYEAPLVRPGGSFPRRVEGRAEIRDFLATLHEHSAGAERRLNLAQSRYTLHITSDPDIFSVL